MDARIVVLAWAVAAALPAAAEVRVQQVGELLDVDAAGAPVSEVLDRLARQTGMQVVYEGAPPRLPVTLSIARRTPAEAVFSVLDGLGLNYALRLDESGGRVLTLVMTGAAGASAPGGAGRPAGASGEPSKITGSYPPPPSYPQEGGEEEFIDPNAGVIPPPPPQPPQEFAINPQQAQPQTKEEQQQQQQQPNIAAPSLGSGFSSPFSSSGFSSPPLIGNAPLEAAPAPVPPPGEPPQEEKEP